MSYIYLVVVDGVVRYVGKGTGNRVDRHVPIATRLNLKRDSDLKVKATPFHNKLAKAIRKGAVVETEIVVVDLSENEAYALEVEWMAKFPQEQLWNFREGGFGFTSGDMKRLWERNSFREKTSAAIKAGQVSSAIFLQRLRESATKKWAEPGHRERRSQETSALWDDPDFRDRQIAARVGIPHDKDHKEKIAAGLARYFDNPDAKAKRVAELAALRQTDEYKESHRQGMRELHDDPERSGELKKAMSERMLKMWEDPAHREMVTKRMKDAAANKPIQSQQNTIAGVRASWADPVARDKRISAMKSAITPDVRNKMSESAKAANTPELREKKRTAMKAFWAKRRSSIPD